MKWLSIAAGVALFACQQVAGIDGYRIGPADPAATNGAGEGGSAAGAGANAGSAAAGSAGSLTSGGAGATAEAGEGGTPGGPGGTGGSDGTAGAGDTAGSGGTDAPGGTGGSDSPLNCDANQQECDGACVPLDDPSHCGSCEHDCSALPNVEGDVQCVDGTCVVPATSCAAGYGHCSADPNDGCEADLRTPARCGSCEQMCMAPTPLCSGNLSSGYECADACTTDAPTLCGQSCVNTQTDAAHCNMCNRTCPAPTGGQARCSGGQCTFDCDSTRHACSDGSCALNTSVTQCGANCVTCSRANATPSCVSGACQYTCNNGYHACNNNTVCLSDTSPASCGTRCTACPVPTGAEALCVAGECSSRCLSATPNSCNGTCQAADCDPGDACLADSDCGGTEGRCDAATKRCTEVCTSKSMQTPTDVTLARYCREIRGDLTLPGSSTLMTIAGTDLPYLTLVTGNLTMAGGSIRSVTLTALTEVRGMMTLSGAGTLASFPALTTVGSASVSGSGLNVQLFAMPDLLMPQLTRVNGPLTITISQVARIDMRRLARVTGNLELSDLYQLTNLDFRALTTVDGSPKQFVALLRVPWSSISFLTRISGATFDDIGCCVLGGDLHNCNGGYSCN